MPSPATTNQADPQMCRQCRGLCCQAHPGVWVNPERFLALFNLTVPTNPDDWQATLNKHQLELRDIDKVLIPAPQRTENGCILHDNNGCRLPEEKRPCQCLALTPSLETLIEGEIHCHLPPEGSTATAIKQWRQFWENT